MAKSQDREKLYSSLRSKIGNTPLVKYSGDVSNDNSILIKRECDNPFGSHYDRVYLALFETWERAGRLAPGASVLETTSGSAGVSFAGIGKELGYKCYVMIPGGKQLQRRRDAIEEQGANLVITPEDEYINGFTRKRILAAKEKYRAKFLNHSMGPFGTNNETTLASLGSMATEILNEIDVYVYVAGIGNGSSVVGPGRVFRKSNPNIQIIGYKPARSGKSRLPGLVNQEGLDPSIVIPFPHIIEANKLMDDVVLIEDLNVDVLCDDDLGKTTRAGISVALGVAEKVNSKNILVVGYDKIDRY